VKKEKVLLLISGGIDSPVAAKLLQEEGYELKAIHFSQEPFTDNTPEKKSLLLCRKLGIKEMIVVDAGEELKEIADNTYREYYFVLMKRFFMKTSEKIAQKEGCSFLATGESIGQVSSQTASNLNNINLATEIEILRPVMFMSKQEIINKSEKEGYFEISKGPEMCDALASGKVKTKTNLEDLINEEKKCNIDKLIENAVKKIRKENTNQEVKIEVEKINTCKPKQ
jgi:thiamine biosynthesis protein ThiI